MSVSVFGFDKTIHSFSCFLTLSTIHTHIDTLKKLYRKYLGLFCEYVPIVKKKSMTVEDIL